MRLLSPRSGTRATATASSTTARTRAATASSTTSARSRATARAGTRNSGCAAGPRNACARNVSTLRAGRRSAASAWRDRSAGLDFERAWIRHAARGRCAWACVERAERKVERLTHELRPHLPLLRREHLADLISKLGLHLSKLLASQGGIGRRQLLQLSHLQIPLVGHRRQLLLLRRRQIHLLLERRVVERAESLKLPIQLIKSLPKAGVGDQRIERAAEVLLEPQLKRLQLPLALDRIGVALDPRGAFLESLQGVLVHPAESLELRWSQLQLLLYDWVKEPRIPIESADGNKSVDPIFPKLCPTVSSSVGGVGRVNLSVQLRASCIWRSRRALLVRGRTGPRLTGRCLL